MNLHRIYGFLAVDLAIVGAGTAGIDWPWLPGYRARHAPLGEVPSVPWCEGTAG